MRPWLSKGVFSKSVVTKNLVFGCAAALLMAGSAVTALPDVQAGEVLVAGNHGNHGHKDNNKNHKNSNGNKKGTKAKATTASVITARVKAGTTQARARDRGTKTRSRRAWSEPLQAVVSHLAEGCWLGACCLTNEEGRPSQVEETA